MYASVPRVSLRATLMGVVLLAIVPALGLTLWNGVAHMREERGDAQAKALILARNIADEQKDIRESTRRILRTLALTSPIQDRDPEQSARLLESLLKEYGEPYLNFIALGLDGQAYAQAIRGQPLNNYADRTWFGEIARTGNFTSSEYLVGKATGLPTMAMAYPVRDGEGRIHSLLAAGVGMSGLRQQLASSLLPPQSVITVIDHEGIVLAREPPMPELVGTSQRDAPLVQEALGQEEGVTEAEGVAGVPRIVAFTRMFRGIANSPVIYVGIARDAAYAAAWEGLFIQVAWLVGLGLVGLAAARALGERLLVRPARTITRAADLLGAGRLSERLGEAGRVVEFNQISHAFNRMAERQEERTGQLEKQAAALLHANRELEHEVATRLQAEASLALNVEMLRRSNEELEQFAYVASHDLQEPLRIIHSYLQLIERRYQSLVDEDGRRFIRATMDAAGRMRALIHGLLDYSRVSTRARPFERVETEDVLAEVVEFLGEALAETRAVVRREALPAVSGDRAQIVHVFQNLLSNAVKYHPPGVSPEVRVSAVRDGSMWRFTVQDNGIGIAPEYQERIFALFQRLHTRAQYPGTGIGLTLCKKIVERHNGRIWVESEAGKGAAFHFTLPAMEETP